MQKIDFPLRGDHITLDRLLKATGLAGSGAQAKQLVADGKVQVDGRDELRKTAKLRAGGQRDRHAHPAAAAGGGRSGRSGWRDQRALGRGARPLAARRMIHPAASPRGLDMLSAR